MRLVRRKICIVRLSWLQVVGAFVAGLSVLGVAKASDDSDRIIQESFFPYEEGFPVDVPAEGTVIGPANVDDYKDLFDPVTFEHIKEGFRPPIEVGPTLSIPMHPAYIEASKNNIGRVEIRDGNLANFEGGRPFPEAPSLDDPRAGEKLGWNFRHTWAAGDNIRIYPFYWNYIDAEAERRRRQVKYHFSFLNFKYRFSEDPIPEVTPNPNNYFRAIYGKVFEPDDLRNTQLLIQVPDNDMRRPDGYLYLGFQRRLRRLETSQIYDSFLGSDLMIIDFEGYFGRIADMDWEYKGTKVKLLPVYRHNDQELSDEFEEPDGFQYIAMHGRGNCFMKVTWSPRLVHIVEQTPRDAAATVGRRVLYFDAQTMVLPRTLIYDRADRLWKSWSIGYTPTEGHLPINEERMAAIYNSYSMFDVQNMTCTTGQFRTEISSDHSPPRHFTPAFVRGGGVRH